MLCSLCGGRKEDLPYSADSSALEENYEDALWNYRILGEAKDRDLSSSPLREVAQYASCSAWAHPRSSLLRGVPLTKRLQHNTFLDAE